MITVFIDCIDRSLCPNSKFWRAFPAFWPSREGVRKGACDAVENEPLKSVAVAALALYCFYYVSIVHKEGDSLLGEEMSFLLIIIIVFEVSI